MGRRSYMAVVIVLVLLAGAFASIIAFLTPSTVTRAPRGRTASTRSEALGPTSADGHSNPFAGQNPDGRAKCASCHASGDIFDQKRWSFLNSRWELSQQTWAEAIPLQSKCGSCHAVPDPSNLARKSWSEVLTRMAQVMEVKTGVRLSDDERQDILHFYFAFSPERLPVLPADPDPARSPVKFESTPIGVPHVPDAPTPPVLGHVQIVDLDQDGNLDVLVCDTDRSSVAWVRYHRGIWREDRIAEVPCPARTQVVTNATNGRRDLVVACQGIMAPTDDPVGSVVLLINDGAGRFNPSTLLDGVGRVADAEPGDFDGDGDLDFVVAAYGFIKEGEVGWLENKSNDRYAFHRVVKRTGAIDVLPIDLEQDGRLDFVALFAQEHEQISAFVNAGNGRFQERVLFKARTPCFGSSGIQLVDLDRDGDKDILYTNGDNMDLPTLVPRPYHGVQWLENKGNLEFVWRDICRFYGAYCAVAGDLNNDGDLDIVVTSLFNDWPNRKRTSVIWLENNGQQRFAPHGLAREPIQLISAALGDLDQDGWLDVVACGMHAFPPFDRLGRITLWKNDRARRGTPLPP